MFNGKSFTPSEAAVLEEIIRMRRDVRGQRFTDRQLDDGTVDQLLSAALHAPSVGFSQPWEFVLIRDRGLRLRVKESFDEENEKAILLFEQRRKEKETVVILEKYGG
jgi:5,6-dimethylbenzimidazole synthase